MLAGSVYEFDRRRWLLPVATIAPHSFLARIGAAMLILAGIAWLDSYSGPEVQLFVFYLLPILYVTSQIGQRMGIVMCVICVASSVAVGWHDGADVGPAKAMTAAARLLVSVLVVVGWGRLHKMGQALAELSLTDPLTGLQNRRGCLLRGEAELTRMRRSGECLSLMYIDLDNFKAVNDIQGHKAGDRLLRVTAEVLLQSIRESDAAARMGGDEFVLILPGANSWGGRSLGETIRRGLCQAYRNEGVDASASVGVATFYEAPATFEEALHDADQVMYRTKRANKGEVLQQDVRRKS